METFNNIICESNIILNTRELDPLIFQSNPGMQPILRDSVRVQILKDIDELRYKIDVRDFAIVGDILTKKYKKDTPINILIEMDSLDVNDIIAGDLSTILKRLNNRLAADTLHPIRYHLITRPIEHNKFIAAYDVLNDRWLKTPSIIGAEVEKIFSDYCESLKSVDVVSGKIHRDALDYDTIGDLKVSSIKSLYNLIEQKMYQDYELIRHDVGGKSHITDNVENITIFSNNYKLREYTIQKLYEIHYSRIMLGELKYLIKFKEKNNNDIKQSIRESVKRLGKLKVSGNSHLHKNRSLNRKNLRQVPDSQRPVKTNLVQTPGVSDFVKGLNVNSRVVDTAKSSPKGIWRISKPEVLNIAAKYGFNVPNDDKPMKHLGSTGIQMVRLKPNYFYLYKPGRTGTRKYKPRTTGVKVKGMNF